MSSMKLFPSPMMTNFKSIIIFVPWCLRIGISLVLDTFVVTLV